MGHSQLSKHMSFDERRETLLYDLARVLDDLTPVVRKLSALVDVHDGLWTGADLQEKLKISKDENTLLVAAGMPHYKIGKGYRYKPDEVYAFIQRFRKVTPQPHLPV